MGNELASFDEWNELRSLPWNLKTYPKHDSIARMIRDLNLIYAAETALHIHEHDPARFNWLMVDNSDQSVFAFERHDNNGRLIFVFNMTGNYYHQYDIGVTIPGRYVEIFNSDKDVYGGWNQYNGAPLSTTDQPGPEHRPHTLTIKLASFGALILKHDK